MPTAAPAIAPLLPAEQPPVQQPQAQQPQQLQAQQKKKRGRKPLVLTEEERAAKLAREREQNRVMQALRRRMHKVGPRAGGGLGLSCRLRGRGSRQG